VVDLDATLGEQLFDVALRQPEAQVPTDSQDDHLGREPEAGEGRLRDGSRARPGSHASSVTSRRCRGQRNSAPGVASQNPQQRLPFLERRRLCGRSAFRHQRALPVLDGDQEDSPK
jgi:hypothetical protein